MTQRYQIAVVGCGIGGMAAAILLAGHGHQVTLFERFEAAKPVGSGLMIQPTGQRVLEHLGMLEALAQCARPIRYLIGDDVGGARPLALDYADIDPQWRGYGVHRATLFDLLFKGVQQSSANLVLGAEVTDRHKGDGGRWHLVVNGAPSQQGFDLIVDAGGVGSQLREGRVQYDRAFDFGAVWSTLSIPGMAQDCLAQRHRGAREMFGALPLGHAPGIEDGSAFAIFWSLKSTQIDHWRQHYDGWLDRIDSMWPQVAEAVRAQLGQSDFQGAHYRDLVMRRFFGDGIVHIGDAAHSTSPQLGQGGNLALIDAWSLSGRLSTCGSIPQALADYDKARRPQVHLYQHFSRLCTPLFQSESAGFGTLRNLSFPIAMRMRPVRKTMNRVMAGVQTGWMPWQHKSVDGVLS